MFSRLELLIGHEALQRLQQANVLLPIHGAIELSNTGHTTACF